MEMEIKRESDSRAGRVKKATMRMLKGAGICGMIMAWRSRQSR